MARVAGQFLFWITIQLVHLSSFKFLFAMFILSNAACGIDSPGQEVIPPTASITTFSVTPSPTPLSAETSLVPPPSSEPTVLPADGITSAQVNVRAGPSTASHVLGIIPPDMRVEIVGKDPGGSWWQILYRQGTDGRGWVTAQYIHTVSTPEVPIIGGPGAEPNDGSVAVIQQQINVRSGPGMDFNSVGTLNPQDTVHLLGKDANGTWLQIAFGAGPEGTGWIHAAFAHATGVENLPIVTEAGLILGTGTPTSIPLTPTATIVPAPEDNDSPAQPIIRVQFEPAGTHSSIYTGDVSAPQGDRQDWIQFTPYSQTVLLQVICKGNDLEIEILQNNLTIAATGAIHCGSQQMVPTEPNLPVTIGIAAQSDGGLSYTSYTLHLETIP